MLKSISKSCQMQQSWTTILWIWLPWVGIQEAWVWFSVTNIKTVLSNYKSGNSVLVGLMVINDKGIPLQWILVEFPFIALMWVDGLDNLWLLTHYM